jgi:hypothetical protein
LAPPTSVAFAGITLTAIMLLLTPHRRRRAAALSTRRSRATRTTWSAPPRS